MLEQVKVLNNAQFDRFLELSNEFVKAQSAGSD